MKQILRYVPLFFSLLCVSYSYAQPQEQFLRANSVYNAGNYASAFSMYQEIPDKGRAVWYNMGNCAYHTKKYLEALVYWSRAEQCATWSEYNDIQVNKSQIYRIFDMSEPSKTFFETYIVCAIPWCWSWIFVQVICLLLCVVLFLFWYKSKYRWQKIVIVCTYITICLYAYQVYRWYQAQQAVYAYVNDKVLVVYNGPDSRSHERGSISYAHKVCVLDQRDEWSKINTSGLVGWVKTTSLLVV